MSHNHGIIIVNIRFETPQHALSTRPPYGSTGIELGVTADVASYVTCTPGHIAASCPTGRPPRLRFDCPTKHVKGNVATSTSAERQSLRECLKKRDQCRMLLSETKLSL